MKIKAKDLAPGTKDPAPHDHVVPAGGVKRTEIGVEIETRKRGVVIETEIETRKRGVVIETEEKVVAQAHVAGAGLRERVAGQDLDLDQDVIARIENLQTWPGDSLFNLVRSSMLNSVF